MKNIRNTILSAVATMFLMTACVGDLDVTPIDPNVVSSGNVYNTVQDYKEGLAKLYVTFALSGQQGPDGMPDIEGIDEGFGNYLRLYWNLQELSTDEAVLSWNDQTIKDFHNHSWTPTDVFLAAMHSRIMYTIALSNEFIRAASESSDAEVQTFIADARFIRALAYSHGLDLFGPMPFVTEEHLPGAFFPERISRADLFDYLVTELDEIIPLLGAPKFEYGRADQGAAQMLLAKLYLNAEVYTGTARYGDCITALDALFAGPYSLSTDFLHNFVADNHTSPEIIFPITYDANNTQTWGGMVYLLQAQSIPGNPDIYGVGGWGGLRVTSALPNKFDFANDGRALFHTDGQTLEIDDVGVNSQGYGSAKYRNRKLNGDPADGSNGDNVDTDYPMFRLADAYLMYAEAVYRRDGSVDATALGYINALRERAYGDTSGNVTAGDVNDMFLLDERARELFWEGHRRSDLVRFGQFTDGTYQWPWKGNVAEGVASEPHRDVYPIPSTQLTANPNLIQNEDY